MFLDVNSGDEGGGAVTLYSNWAHVIHYSFHRKSSDVTTVVLFKCSLFDLFLHDKKNSF